MDEKEKNNRAVVNAGDAELAKKQSLFSMIFAGDFRTALRTTVANVIVPKIAETVTESINVAANSMVYGDDYYPSSPSVRTDYTKPSSAKAQSKARMRSEAGSADHRNVRDILFKDPRKAKEVKDEIEANAMQYDVITVNDFYDFAHMSDQALPNDDKYGWDNLRGKSINIASTRYFNEETHRYENRWYIDLPKAISIE